MIGAAALAGFYLALWLVFPDQLGLGDAKIAASIGLVLAWGSWSELFSARWRVRSWAPRTRGCCRQGAGQMARCTCRWGRFSWPALS